MSSLIGSTIQRLLHCPKGCNNPQTIRISAFVARRGFSTAQCIRSTTLESSDLLRQAPRLFNKVAVVTGASSGLGRAIAFNYAKNGAKLVVCADLRAEPRPGIESESQPTHEAICEKFGSGKALFVRTDVTKATDVETVVREAVKAAGRLDM